MHELLKRYACYNQCVSWHSQLCKEICDCFSSTSTLEGYHTKTLVIDFRDTSKAMLFNDMMGKS